MYLKKEKTPLKSSMRALIKKKKEKLNLLSDYGKK